MVRHLTQPPPWIKTNRGDRIPYADKVDPDDPARADILITINQLVLAGVEIDDRAIEIATKLAKWRQEQVLLRESVPAGDVPHWKRKPGESTAPCWVYYVRCGHLVKIGTTADLAQRFTSIRPNEVLALEPGGQQLETERHREFRSLRASGEYFHPGPALQKHVMQLRADLGAPKWIGSLVPDGQDFFPGNPS